MKQHFENSNKPNTKTLPLDPSKASYSSLTNLFRNAALFEGSAFIQKLMELFDEEKLNDRHEHFNTTFKQTTIFASSFQLNVLVF